MKHVFVVGVREVHVSHRIVSVDDTDNPGNESPEDLAKSKAGDGEEIFLEYSHTMDKEHSDIRAATQEEIDELSNEDEG
jgi:hypothetical protein